MPLHSSLGDKSEKEKREREREEIRDTGRASREGDGGWSESLLTGKDTKGCWRPPEAREKAGDRVSLRAPRRTNPPDASISDLWTSRTVRE